MSSLNVIGGGRVGKTLGILWHRSGVAQIQDVLCRSESSAEAATACIGSGRAVVAWDALRPADVHLLSVPDDALPETVQRLAESVNLEGSVVFHSSGWLSSTDLLVAADKGASVASVHPIKGFPDPTTAADSFAGTWCGIEGDDRALGILRPAFEKVGALLVDVDTEKKPLYHTATVIACNYVVGLTALAQQSLVAAGIDSDQALEMLIPLLRGTVDNLERLGPVAALTGPVARGDATTVASHIQALSGWDDRIARTYIDLAGYVVDLAAKQGTSPESLSRITAALTSARLSSKAT